MPRPRTPARQKIDQRSEWDADNNHLIWTGSLHRGRPHLRPEGHHPVRILLKVHDHRLFVRRTCTHPLCINPDHHKVQITQDHKYGDAAPPTWHDPRSSFTAKEEAQIEEGVELLSQKLITTEKLADFCEPHVIKEIEARCS